MEKGGGERSRGRSGEVNREKSPRPREGERTKNVGLWPRKSPLVDKLTSIGLQCTQESPKKGGTVSGTLVLIEY